MPKILFKLALPLFTTSNRPPILDSVVHAHTEAKRLVNRSSLLHDDAHLVAAGETFLNMLTWPETRSRIDKILERGFQKPGDFELMLGHNIGTE